MDIKNENDLQVMIEIQARLALEGATEEILERFKKDYLRKYVYDSHGDNEEYHGGSGMATYQFEESWEWTEIKRVTDILVTEMWYNPDDMDFDRDSFLHGSKYSKPQDVRHNLMDILNKKGFSSDLWLSVYRPVAYWEQFIVDLFDRGELHRIITKHFIKQGFTTI